MDANTNGSIRLEAESIATFIEQYDRETELPTFSVVLFHPTQATMDLLFNLKGGTEFTGMELVDKWDDGTEDTHSSQRTFDYISYEPQAGHKQHTQIVKFHLF